MRITTPLTNETTNFTPTAPSSVARCVSNTSLATTTREALFRRNRGSARAGASETAETAPSKPDPSSSVSLATDDHLESSPLEKRN
jgi:hypothetical protein